MDSVLNRRTSSLSEMGDNVLVIGGGAREHSIAWCLTRSESVGGVYVSPGNAGTETCHPKVRNVSLDFTNHSVLTAWCRDYDVKLVVVGPEDPLANGLADYLKGEGIACFGPCKQAALIESSKEFSKSFMDRYNIPTARWMAFTDSETAKQHILSCPYAALVIKASGLAAGKGVIVTTSKEEACRAVDIVLKDKIFGTAGDVVVVEELLLGQEVSVLAFSDGESVEVMPPAQDHKRLLDDDRGPNTGGMGAYAPCPLVTASEMESIKTEIIQRTVTNLKKEGRPFVGVLFAGIMLTKDGPKVLEFNCRFGDPETQAILPLLSSDLYPIMLACVRGDLKKANIQWKPSTHAVGIVLASGGYPGSYAKGKVIEGLAEASRNEDVLVFHAGTDHLDDKIVTSGGRVICAVALGSHLVQTIQRALHAAQIIDFEGKQYRKDIGHHALSRYSETGSYKDAGVDIDAGNELVQKIKRVADLTGRSGLMGAIGGFGALFDLKAAGFVDPVLVSGTDGVGTKLLVADAVGHHSSVGIDLVAMCVNDILAHGAEPLFFLDYYACGKLHVDVATDVVAGIAEGCRLANCALVGGETAEMPGVYPAGVYDIAGFAVGAVERKKLLPRTNEIVTGDVVIGIASSGAHSNGFSLIRKIVEKSQASYHQPAPFNPNNTLGKELLTSTKIYVRSILPVIQKGAVKAYSHITGGGLTENIPRVLPPTVGVLLDANLWPIPPLFTWLAVAGNVPDDEMLRTFNCGLGAVVIVDPSQASSVVQQIQEAGESAWVIGGVVPQKQGEPLVHVSHFHSALYQTDRLQSITLAQGEDGSTKRRVGVLISGSGTNLQALLDYTLDPRSRSTAEIALVISNVPNVEGLARAERAGVQTKVISHKSYSSRVEFDRAVHRALVDAQIEIVCLAGFMRVLTGEFVNKWQGKLINIHPALLPSFKGIHAHKQALDAGVRITGCTVHYVVENIDAGAILVQEAVPIDLHDTVDSLTEKVKVAEHRAYPTALELVASGKVKYQPDGTIQWNA